MKLLELEDAVIDLDIIKAAKLFRKDSEHEEASVSIYTTLHVFNIAFEDEERVIKLFEKIKLALSRD